MESKRHNSNSNFKTGRYVYELHYFYYHLPFPNFLNLNIRHVDLYFIYFLFLEVLLGNWKLIFRGELSLRVAKQFFLTFFEFKDNWVKHSAAHEIEMYYFAFSIDPSRKYRKILMEFSVIYLNISWHKTYLDCIV